MKIQPRPIGKKPPWLRRRLPSGPEFERIRSLVDGNRLHTVCQEAKCPNIWECFSSRTATFLILGDRCTRNCRFCAVRNDSIQPPDPGEPQRVAEAAAWMSLKYAVVTSVTRDDLADGGAGHFAATIEAIRNRLPEAKIEVLIPDFEGSAEALAVVLTARPDVLNHNMETAARLYASVRPGADYRRSIELLHRAAQWQPPIPTKSGLMLGLGETSDEIRSTLKDLREADCRFLTLGQYLQPSREHLPVERFVPTDEFDRW